MIYEHDGLALNLFQIKAIKKERRKKGGVLVFEFYNTIMNVETSLNSGVWEKRSFPNASVSQNFDDSDNLEIAYHEWVGLWQGFCDYVQRGQINIWREQHGVENLYE